MVDKESKREEEHIKKSEEEPGEKKVTFYVS